MISRLPAHEFMKKALSVPVIDVRSPAEFDRGHIPGSHNIPLFDDLERAEVGTLYHKAGRDEAVGKGMEIAGPRMRAYLARAREMAVNNELLVYCWRGGMRSESMAWLFSTGGMEASVLEHGYKGFRRYFKSAFEREQQLSVIGGMTGSGKTKLLKLLAGSGLQTIDLEGLAHHKGSVFGSLGQAEQPSQEHFENQLGMAWLALDPARPVFLEDESLNIGRVAIPQNLYEKMQHGQLICIDMPLEFRVERLFREYAHFSAGDLTALIEKIRRRLGGANATEAVKAIKENRLKDAIRISLLYYDKVYSYDLRKRDAESIVNFNVQNDETEALLPVVLRYIEN